jgi:hypothetical protein
MNLLDMQIEITIEAEAQNSIPFNSQDRFKSVAYPK